MDNEYTYSITTEALNSAKSYFEEAVKVGFLDVKATPLLLGAIFAQNNALISLVHILADELLDTTETSTAVGKLSRRRFVAPTGSDPIGD